MIKKFDYSLPYITLDLRKQPELYSVGIGEQGVLLVEPYKSEILPFWRFKTPEIADESAKKIFDLFLDYLKDSDFVGADMSRKFLQMGYTRSRRYANHSTGTKYATDRTILPQNTDWKDNTKAKSAQIFYGYYLKARENPLYKKLKLHHKQVYEQ